jgi:hypothetical protein
MEPCALSSVEARDVVWSTRQARSEMRFATLTLCLSLAACSSGSPTTTKTVHAAPADEGLELEAFARRTFEAAFAGDERGVRERMASYEEVSDLTARRVDRAEHDRRAAGLLRDLVVREPKSPRVPRLVGVKVILHRRYALGENQKLRRAAELGIVRFVVTDGRKTATAPFNFAFARTARGWRLLPGE